MSNKYVPVEALPYTSRADIQESYKMLMEDIKYSVSTIRELMTENDNKDYHIKTLEDLQERRTKDFQSLEKEYKKTQHELDMADGNIKRLLISTTIMEEKRYKPIITMDKQARIIKSKLPLVYDGDNLLHEGFVKTYNTFLRLVSDCQAELLQKNESPDTIKGASIMGVVILDELNDRFNKTMEEVNARV